MPHNVPEQSEHALARASQCADADFEKESPLA